MQDSIQVTYERWLEGVSAEDKPALEKLAADPAALSDAFYRDLAFGTGGLRGTLGMGPNRMNAYTVGKATQGLAAWVLSRAADGHTPSVAIGHDSRHGSVEFSQRAASVLAANGIHAYLYPRLEPTPALSFAVRDLGCDAGIVITASHNPKEYNGYKVYGPDGCQITTEMARQIQAAIDAVDPFEGVAATPFDDALAAGSASWIGEDALDRYVAATLARSTGQDLSGLKLVYTPLNGTGTELVTRVLAERGCTDVTLVPEQAEPDGDFPTCPYPNPEIREALQLGIELARSTGADMLLGTDPDADRVGIAVRHDGDYRLLNGNEVGLLLLDWLARRAVAAGADATRLVACTTVVSAPMADDLARDLGFELRRTLTGFKFIGEQAGLLEAVGREGDFLMGFEESYGYLSGTHVRDKDAVVSAMLICEMAAAYKAEGLDLYDAMRALYDRYGHWGSELVSVKYPGEAGAERMRQIMGSLRAEAPAELAGEAVESVTDYASGAPMPVVNAAAGEPAQLLPASDVLELRLAGGSRVLVRPSGTEPKVKAYVFARGADAGAAADLLARLVADVRALLG